MAQKITDSTNLGYVFTKIKTWVTSTFWPKADVVNIGIDNTPTANSDNLVKSGGVKSYVDGAIPSVPVTDVTVGGSSVVDGNGTAVVPAIPTVPTISTDIDTDATSDTKTTSPKAVKTFVEGKGYTTNTGTVTGIKVGTTDYSPTSGVVSLPAYPSVPVTDVTVGGSSVVSNGTAVIPAIPDAVEANPTVPSGTTPTTLNNLKIGSDYYAVGGGSSVTLSTNVATDKTDNTKASTPASVYNFVKPASQSSQPVGGMEPGVLYNLDVLTGSVTISLASPADANVANEYAFTFFTGSTAPTITWPNTILAWAGNCIINGSPYIVASKYYEVSILNGIAVIIETEV